MYMLNLVNLEITFLLDIYAECNNIYVEYGSVLNMVHIFVREMVQCYTVPLNVRIYMLNIRLNLSNLLDMKDKSYECNHFFLNLKQGLFGQGAIWKAIFLDHLLEPEGLLFI
jgi:hypothetical protein